MNSSDTDCPVNVPGLWHNGDCSLLCRRTKWYDMLIFFIGNYIAHVATVSAPPGASVFRRVQIMVSALLFPVSGLSLGVQAILSRAIFAPTPLQTAARAGALCMVAKCDKDERPVRGTTATGQTQDTENVDGQEQGSIELAQRSLHDLELSEALQWPNHRPWFSINVHGRYALPKGYELVQVPWDAEFEDDTPQDSTKWYDPILRKFQKQPRRTTELACSYNAVKSLVSIVQIIFGIVTLYRTRGNEIDRYGYAAFGLTVTPYAWMSFINLIGNLMRPEYPSMYIVGSRLLDTIQDEHGAQWVTAPVGRLKEGNGGAKSRRSGPEEFELPITEYLLPYAGLSVPLLVTGVLSKFAKGHSTHAQRVWIMCWLVFGALINPGIIANPVLVRRTRQGSFADNDGWLAISMLFSAMAYTAPAIGGFVVVAKMINEHGICTKMLNVKS